MVLVKVKFYQRYFFVVKSPWVFEKRIFVAQKNAAMAAKFIFGAILSKTKIPQLSTR